MYMRIVWKVSNYRPILVTLIMVGYFPDSLVYLEQNLHEIIPILRGMY